jgi:hypothetical protein
VASSSSNVVLCIATGSMLYAFTAGIAPVQPATEAWLLDPGQSTLCCAVPCCAVLWCRLKLGAFINLDLCPVLNGQPLQMMCKNVQV